MATRRPIADLNTSGENQIAPQLRAGLRKRWLYILPAVFVTYSLAYLDRANYGFGAAAGLAATLHITSSQSALLGALFFLGYFLFQIPGVIYARRKSVTGLLFFALVAWGIFAALTGVIRTFWLLAADRMLLGVAESFVFPAMLILLTHWFTRAERASTNTLLMLGNPVTVLWMSAVTGFIIHAVGWQMAFIFEGVPAVIWAFLWLRLVRDRPAEAPWLDDSAKDYLAAQLEREQEILPRIPNLKTAFRQPSVTLLSIQYFFWSMGIYAFVLWLPTTIRRASASSIQMTGLLGAAPYMLAVVFMLVAGHFADRARRRKHFIWPFLMLAGITLFASYAVIAHAFWLAYGFLIVAGASLYAPYGPFFALIPDMLPKNVAGEVMALINSWGALGGFFGVWLAGVLQARTGSSRDGFLFMAVSLVLSAVLTLFLHNPSKPESAPLQHQH